MHYKHLAKEERYYIFCSLESGKSMRTVARELNRSTATISREYARNKGLRGYRYPRRQKGKVRKGRPVRGRHGSPLRLGWQ